MTFFNDMGRKLTMTGQGAIQKSKDMVEITRLNSQMGELNKNTEVLCRAIGRIIMEEYVGIAAEEIEAELDKEVHASKKSVLKKVVEIKKIELKILECQEQIKSLKGIVHCPNCGANVRNDALFCGKCGFRMETEEKNAKMKACKKCGALIPEDSVFCVSCGCKVDTSVAVKICPKCGNNLEEGTTFCENCGTNVSEQDSTVGKEKQRCPQCGAPLAEDTVFCEECGAKIQEY